MRNPPSVALSANQPGTFKQRYIINQNLKATHRSLGVYGRRIGVCVNPSRLLKLLKPEESNTNQIMSIKSGDSGEK